MSAGVASLLRNRRHLPVLQQSRVESVQLVNRILSGPMTSIPSTCPGVSPNAVSFFCARGPGLHRLAREWADDEPSAGAVPGDSVRCGERAALERECRLPAGDPEDLIGAGMSHSAFAVGAEPRVGDVERVGSGGDVIEESSALEIDRSERRAACGGRSRAPRRYPRPRACRRRAPCPWGRSG